MSEPLALPVLNATRRDTSCVRCDLSKAATTVCVPTTWLHPDGPSFPASRTETYHKRAVIVVGEAPGKSEDIAGKPFVGQSGRMLLGAYINFFKLMDKVDVFLSNAVRCRPPQNKTPTTTQLKMCHGFLMADIITLQRLYDEVIILAVGGSAVTTVKGCSLKSGMGEQGDLTDFKQLLGTTQRKYIPILEGIVEQIKKDPSDPPYPEPCRVFATYHPAYLLRNPSAGLAVKAHVTMLCDYLEGKLDYEIDADGLQIQTAPLPPRYSVERLSFDLETYGFFKDGPAQTQFHPLKMEAYDGVNRTNILRTVALSWKDPQGQYHHAIYLPHRPDHRRRLWAWFKKIRFDKNFKMLLGQNLTFDLACIRHCYPECKVWLDYPLPVMDTIITNYLHDEGRPEKSLKNLAPLFRITKYEGKGGDVKKYDNAEDQKAWRYNVQDTFATYRLQEKLEWEILGFYGKSTSKLSEFCMTWYSELLWLIVWMTETGVAISSNRLNSLFSAALKRYESVTARANKEFEMPMRGKGSETAKRQALQSALDKVVELGIDKPKLELTGVTGQISFNVENRSALLEVLPKGLEETNRLNILGEYQDIAGMMDRYLYPLTVGRGKLHDDPSTKALNGVCYPKWFPVPSEYDDNSSGGTKQARIVCKGPPIQTFPKSVKRCIWSRYSDGYLVWFDYSQIELRVAALLSGDPVMFNEYLGKPDLHTKTAKLIFGDDIVDHPEFKTKYRQAGKTLNFLVLYGGGAKKFHQTLLRDVGIDYPPEKCQEAIDAFWERHPQLRKWQQEMVKFVRVHHYFELPLIGQSRLFLGGKKAKDAAMTEIVNMPVQAIAAVIMQSAQFHLWWAFKQRKMKSLVPINIYDAAAIEVPRHELYAVQEIMAKVLPNPPYYQALCDHLGRRLLLEYEVKVRSVSRKNVRKSA